MKWPSGNLTWQWKTTTFKTTNRLHKLSDCRVSPKLPCQDGWLNAPFPRIEGKIQGNRGDFNVKSLVSSRISPPISPIPWNLSMVGFPPSSLWSHCHRGQDRPASPIYELRRPEASLGCVDLRVFWGGWNMGWFEGQHKEKHGLNMVFTCVYTPTL